MRCGPCKTSRHSQHKVTLRRPDPNATADVAGHAEGWQSRGTRWGAFRTRGGNERFVFDQVQANVTHIVEFPYDSVTRTIDSTWSILYGTRVLNITAAYDVDEAHQTIRCHCIEVK